MKKPILLAVSACALSSVLASCGGVKNLFSLTTKDPVISLSQAKLGVQVKFADGYKFVENPNIDSFKFTTNQGDKMTFTMHGYSSIDPSSYYWTASTSTPGTYKITLEVDGVKNQNDLVITVEEGKYADDSFTLPENIHITYQFPDKTTHEIYKIGNKYVNCNSEKLPLAYVTDPSAKYYYGIEKLDNGSYVWEKQNRVPKNILNNMLNRFKILEKCEYISKTEDTVTISEQTYSIINYLYSFDVVYKCIRSEKLNIVYKLEDGYNDFEVIGIDTSITSFPEEFKLPE